MTLPVLADDPTAISDPPDGQLHIADTQLSDAAWAVAVALGAVVTGMCGHRGVANNPDPHVTPVCPTCDLLARATDLPVEW